MNRISGPSGRVSFGVRGMRLSEGDRVVGMEVVRFGQTLFAVTVNGFGKRTSIDEYPVHGAAAWG
jgi:DNA gyrase subunit A